uniref:6-phosphogluconolactonase n=1 Tax=Aliarcobacter sp. TaxID=2321116 RepID=UPI0040470F3A
MSLDIDKMTNKKEFISKINEIIVYQAKKNIKEKGRFTFVLSGGSTPKDVFIDLAKNHKYSIEWSKVHIFWLDERCVVPTDENSNYKLAYDYLIKELDCIGSVNRMKGELNPSQAAKEYENLLLDFFKKNKVCFDFILLGMGIDGHVASLFPNTEELKEQQKIVLSTNKKHNGFYRITLSSNTINNSKFNLLILKGKQKYEKYKEDNLPKDLVRFDKVLASD